MNLVVSTPSCISDVARRGTTEMNKEQQAAYGSGGRTAASSIRGEAPIAKPPGW